MNPFARSQVDSMEQFLYLSELFDLYGALLTERQQRCLELHLYEDFSLSEIGEELGISRQAVYDNIHRAEAAMKSYEAKLGLAARYEKERAVLSELDQSIAELATEANSAEVAGIRARLAPLLGRGRGGLTGFLKAYPTVCSRRSRSCAAMAS